MQNGTVAHKPFSREEEGDEFIDLAEARAEQLRAANPGDNITIKFEE